MPRRTPTLAASLFIAVLAAPLCAGNADQSAVDASFDAVREAAASAGLAEVVQIDHARLAAAEDVPMPPSRVQIFSDSAINTALLADNIRAGLDLPFRVLSYADGNGAKVSTTFSGFLRNRHGLTDEVALGAFDMRLQEVFERTNDLQPQSPPDAAVTPDIAVIELASSHDVAATVTRLKSAVTAQSDTVWFGEVDFAQEAAALGVDLPPAVLLLFGGPAPGGVAMAEYPAIGLDAFCQKLLVYEGGDGKAIVLFNDIAGLAEWHYGHSAKPHQLLNDRLTATFSAAIGQ